MKRRRAKITGIGPVTPAGIGKEEFWQGILEPVSRIRPYTKLGDQYGPFVAAYIDRLNTTKYVERELLPKGIARHSLFAVVGALLALEDAGISQKAFQAANSAVLTGSAIMDFDGIIRSMDGVREKGVRAAQPRALYSIGIGSAATAVGKVLGVSAHTNAFSNQCISGLDAIGYAAKMIETGETDLILCGGTDTPLHSFPLVELRAAGLTPATWERPERIARPFDLWRTTGVIAEGCCMVLLEPEDSPRPGYSFVAGYGAANDGPHWICDGLVASGKLAIAQTRIHPSDVDVINAWGPGHKSVDKGEAKSMERIFGTHLPDIAAVSIKGAIGSPLAAAPAIQVAVAALAQTSSILPHTVNWDYPDPDCRLNLSNRARSIPHRFTLINSHGLGAVNSSMILERC